MAAVVLLTIGENLHTIAAWQVSFELAPDARHSEYLSAFNCGSSLQRVVGPLMMTAVVLVLPTSGWLILASVFAAAAVGFVVVAATARRVSLEQTARK